MVVLHAEYPESLCLNLNRGRDFSVCTPFTGLTETPAKYVKALQKKKQIIFIRIGSSLIGCKYSGTSKLITSAKIKHVPIYVIRYESLLED